MSDAIFRQARGRLAPMMRRFGLAGFLFSAFFAAECQATTVVCWPLWQAMPAAVLECREGNCERGFQILHVMARRPCELRPVVTELSEEMRVGLRRNAQNLGIATASGIYQINFTYAYEPHYCSWGGEPGPGCFRSADVRKLTEPNSNVVLADYRGQWDDEVNRRYFDMLLDSAPRNIPTLLAVLAPLILFIFVRGIRPRMTVVLIFFIPVQFLLLRVSTGEEFGFYGPVILETIVDTTSDIFTIIAISIEIIFIVFLAVRSVVVRRSARN